MIVLAHLPDSISYTGMQRTFFHFTFNCRIHLISACEMRDRNSMKHCAGVLNALCP
jgi:hypothetical protein